MGAAKEKLVGILLIIVGAFPLLMMIESVKSSLSSYSFISYLVSSQVAILYQVILIVLGVLLLYTPRPRPVAR